MNSSSEELKKRFEFYSAILDVVKIFGETEIGTCEVDEEALSEYCSSDKFVVDNFNIKTKNTNRHFISSYIRCLLLTNEFLDSLFKRFIRFTMLDGLNRFISSKFKFSFENLSIK